jgi:hypothetical protein
VLPVLPVLPVLTLLPVLILLRYNLASRLASRAFGVPSYPTRREQPRAFNRRPGMMAEYG